MLKLKMTIKMKGQKKFVKKQFSTLVAKNLKIILFIIGLSLTIWRGFECLEKFYHSNYSTRVIMVPTIETIRPAITICPGYYFAFKNDILNKYGIKDRSDYKISNLYGNDTSINESDLYSLVTQSFTEIVKSIKIVFKSGRKLSIETFEELR